MKLSTCLGRAKVVSTNAGDLLGIPSSIDGATGTSASKTCLDVEGEVDGDAEGLHLPSIFQVLLVIPMVPDDSVGVVSWSMRNY